MSVLQVYCGGEVCYCYCLLCTLSLSLYCIVFMSSCQAVQLSSSAAAQPRPPVTSNCPTLLMWELYCVITTLQPRPGGWCEGRGGGGGGGGGVSPTTTFTTSRAATLYPHSFPVLWGWGWQQQRVVECSVASQSLVRSAQSELSQNSVTLLSPVLSLARQTKTQQPFHPPPPPLRQADQGPASCGDQSINSQEYREKSDQYIGLNYLSWLVELCISTQ